MPQTAAVIRLPAPSGNRDNDRFQVRCPVHGDLPTLYSNRTVEGRALAVRDARQHLECSTDRKD